MVQCKQKRAHKAQTQETVVCFSFRGGADESESIQEILQVPNNVVWLQKQNKPKKQKQKTKRKTKEKLKTHT